MLYDLIFDEISFKNKNTEIMDQQLSRARIFLLLFCKQAQTLWGDRSISKPDCEHTENCQTVRFSWANLKTCKTCKLD